MKLISVLIFGVVVAFAQFLDAAELNPDKPFAEHHVILQVSDDDPSKFELTLDIANNLIRHYNGPEYIDIEVITFSGGVNLLTDLSGSAYQARIESLMESDVRFFVCLNTIDTITRKTGTRPNLLPGVSGVQTGVAFMLEEIKKGYAHIHP